MLIKSSLLPWKTIYSSAPSCFKATQILLLSYTPALNYSTSSGTKTVQSALNVTRQSSVLKHSFNKPLCSCSVSSRFNKSLTNNLNRKSSTSFLNVASDFEVFNIQNRHFSTYCSLFETNAKTKRGCCSFNFDLIRRNFSTQSVLVHSSFCRTMSSANGNGPFADQHFVFRQLFEKESATYTYLLADKNTKEALLIDPVLETVERDWNLVKDLGLNLKYVINTHMHADHITGTGKLKETIKAERGENSAKSVISKASGAKADEYVDDGSTIKFGNYSLEVRSTPGHTNGCVSYVDHKHRMVFTGDALLIRGCGRTDFQEGDPGMLYDMVHSKILSLDKDYLVYPAHDYTGRMVSTIEEEKEHNPRMKKTRDEFINFMTKELVLAYPKKIDVALPWNKVCGIQELVTDAS